MRASSKGWWFRSDAKHSQSIVAQISPVLWTSDGVPPLGLNGPVNGGTMVLPLAMCLNVSGSFVMSVEYGTRRMPK